MDEKMRRNAARKRVSQTAWTMLIYMLMMNLLVIAVMVVDGIVYALGMMGNGNHPPMDQMIAKITDYLMSTLTSNGWGYILTIVLGGLIAWFWKKKPFWKNLVFHRERKMTFPVFCQLLAVFLTTQAILQAIIPGLEWVLNQFGYSSMAAQEAAAIQTTGFTMFLYVGILAPFSEELLFRGLALRVLQPLGKQISIFLTALMFGLFHGNIIQIPFAFLVGLVLGYVTVEYSVIWAIVLHMINNLVLAEGLNSLSAFLSDEIITIIFYGILGVASVITLILMLLKRRQVAAYFKGNKITLFQIEAAVTSVPMWIFALVMICMGLLSITAI